MPFMHKQLGAGGSFGRDLRELRELRGLTHEDLAAMTRIHPSVMSALEDERIQDLADPIYTERHVRSIVLALEGRPGYFLKKYRELLGTLHAVAPGAMDVRRMARRRDFFVASRLMALLGFLLLVGLAAAYLIWQGRILQDAPRLEILVPVEGAQLVTPRVEARGQTERGAVVTINGRQAVVDSEGFFYLSFDIPRGLTILTFEAKRRYGPSVTETRRVTYQRIPN